MGDTRKNLTSILLRSAVSIFLIIYLLSKSKLGEIIEIILSANILYILIAIALSLFASAFLVCRWGILLKIFFPRISFSEILKYYWSGQFFSLFLPSTMGGDIFRAYKVVKNHGQPILGMIAGLTDRLLGLCSIAMLATPALVLGRFYFKMKILEYFMYFLCVFWVLIFFLLIYIFLYPETKYLRGLFEYFRQGKVFDGIYDGFRLYKRQIVQLHKSLWLSLCATVISIFAAYLLALSIGLSISPLYFYLISSIAFLIAAIPISISGFGLLDGAFVFLLGQVGVSVASALSLSLSMHFLRLLICLFGGLFFIFNKQK